jgi:hypothetical protein
LIRLNPKSVKFVMHAPAVAVPLGGAGATMLAQDAGYHFE